jgi:hypothetical protein
MIRENPDLVQRMVKAMAEAVHYYKNNKDPVVKIMQKYARGPSRTFFEEVYDSNKELLVEDTYPTLEGLKTTLAIQASLDPRLQRPRRRISGVSYETRFASFLKSEKFGIGIVIHPTKPK